MSITDLFKSRWKHPDEHVREEAVKKLDKDDIIEELAQHDPSPLVRAAAVAKLKNPELIKTIAQTQEEDFSVRKEAMQLLEDDHETLLQIAAYLLDLPSFKAVNGLYTNQEMLARIAIYAQDPEVALEAAARIVNQKLLEQITFHGQIPSGRAETASRLHDQKVLAGLARDDKESAVRLKAVEKLTDMETLSVLAFEDPLPEIRAAAVGRLRDPEKLAQAMADPEKSVRRAALKKINDPVTIAWVAVNDTSKTVQTEAIEKLIGDEYLLQVVKESYDPEIRCIAVGRMSNNEELITANIFSDPAPEVRKAGLMHLRTPEAIANVAVTDPDMGIRFMAMNRLETPEDLNLVFTGSSEPQMRATVQAKLGNCQPFAELLPQLDEATRDQWLRLLDYASMDILLHTLRKPEFAGPLMKIFKEQFCDKYIHITEDNRTCACMVCDAHVNDFLTDATCTRCGLELHEKDIQPGYYFFAQTDAGTELVGVCLELTDGDTILADIGSEKAPMKLGNIRKIISAQEYEMLKDKLWQATLVI